MATVISRDIIDNHNINKYNFKVIAMGGGLEENKHEKKDKEVIDANHHPKRRATDVDSSEISTSSKDALIESLMKKTDEMSTNFIKLQMKLEDKEQEFEAKLNEVKESSFKDGFEHGKAEAMKEIDEKLNDSLTLFTNSIKKLDEASNSFKHSLDSLKNELLVAALDISKEVVKVELNENSHEVAKALSDELISDLQTASKIRLKVSPKDFTYISEHFDKLENIEVVADSAVNEGGVVVTSDAGNIDAQISKRFERVKKAVLSE